MGGGGAPLPPAVTDTGAAVGAGAVAEAGADIGAAVEGEFEAAVEAVVGAGRVAGAVEDEDEAPAPGVCSWPGYGPYLASSSPGAPSSIWPKNLFDILNPLLFPNFAIC